MSEFRATLQASLGSAYTVLRELGGGGMSRVFLARDETLGRDVVVKVLAPELAAGLSADRFRREVALAARLQQANIVPLLSAGDMNGLPYFIMPFVEGESLRARMRRAEPPSATEALSILRDVARALVYAHAAGVAHRDIKPDNILLSGGTAVVADFGIAKAITASRSINSSEAETGDITRLGDAVGTPAYMAPEQAAGDPNADHRVDLYAWGMIAWELFAGRHPFHERKTPQAIFAKRSFTIHFRQRLPMNLPRGFGLADVAMKQLSRHAALLH